MRKARVLTFPSPRNVWSFLVSRDESAWKKWLVGAAVLYVLFPIDAIPDLVPVWGWLDDLGVVTLAMAFLSWAVTPYDESRAQPRAVAIRTRR
jgi:uncharacterized membrane protein YkvA (DUF1232 family)